MASKFESKALKIKVANIICDAPARAFVAQIKTHNACHGCGKCTDERFTCNDDKRRQDFVAENKPLRTTLSHLEIDYVKIITLVYLNLKISNILIWLLIYR